MAAIASLRRAVGALTSNPVLFLGGLALGLIVFPQTALQLLGVPIAPTLLQVVTFFITPFVLAGLIGMADEGLDGDTSLSTLTSVGRSRYVSLLFGKLIEFAIAAVFGIVFFVVAIVFAIVVGVSAFGAGAGGISPGAVGGGALIFGAVVFGVLVLAFVVVSFFIQFFPVAIVVDELGGVDGFRRSYAVVRSNLLPALGFSVINLLVSLLTAIPVTGFVVWRTFQRMDAIGAGGTPPGAQPGFGTGMGLFSTTEALALAVVALAMTTVLTTFYQAYATAFYRDHRDGGTGASQSTATATSPTDPGAL